MSRFNEDRVSYARERVRHFAREWYAETPTRLHTSSRDFGDDGAPAFTADFRGYLDESLTSKRRQNRPRGPHDTYSPRRKVTEAFRVLRTKAPKEYDAINCLVVIDRVGVHTDPRDAAGEEALTRQFNDALAATAERFNRRAEKRGEPADYEPDDILILVISAVHKLDLWSG